jgi:hypothetical protein
LAGKIPCSSMIPPPPCLLQDCHLWVPEREREREGAQSRASGVSPEIHNEATDLVSEWGGHRASFLDPDSF